MMELFKKQGQSEIFVDREKLADQQLQNKLEAARLKENERKNEEMRSQLTSYIEKIKAKVRKSRQRKAITA